MISTIIEKHITKQIPIIHSFIVSWYVLSNRIVFLLAQTWKIRRLCGHKEIEESSMCVSKCAIIAHSNSNIKIICFESR